jgi:crotonobetainyl-CoA:carnitine CoA-transferase CaiB-like acyl-CoA transferase
MKHKTELNALLKRIIISRTRDEWVQYFADDDIPLSPVLEYDEVLTDHHVAERGMFTAAPDGDGVVVGFPVRFSNGLPENGKSVPGLDGDRDLILEWLDTAAPEIMPAT